MKILIFGIDGLGKESLNILGLKLLAKRLDSGIVKNPRIHNVISRGWPEIYTGKTAFETGAFYQFPEYINGKVYPTQKTGLSFVKKTINNEELLWNRLNALNLKVGVFTVPTVTTPEKINGFCVGATGAGKFGNGISNQDYYPSNLLSGLNIKDIDLGLRMGYGAYIPNSIEELENYVNKHIADYFYLLNRLLDIHPVDACFAASRFINEMGYKFLGLCKDEPKNEYERKLKKTILKLCESFDSMLEDLINKLNPENLFIVSDHGLGRFDYDINLNQFLSEIGFIRKKTSRTDLKELIRPLYFWIKKNILNQKMGDLTPRYKLESSQLFSIGFTNALYLNDHRFGGKKLTDEQRKIVIQTLVDKLNSHAKVNHLDKFLHFELLQANQHLIGNLATPDIFCKISSGTSNTERKHDVINTRDFAFKKMFINGFYGEHSGCKTEDTIAAYIGKHEDLINFNQLTDVYHSIINVAEIRND